MSPFYFFFVMILVYLISAFCKFVNVERRAWDQHRNDWTSKRRDRRKTKARHRKKLGRNHSAPDIRRVARAMRGEVIADVIQPTFEFQTGGRRYTTTVVTRHRTHTIRVKSGWPDSQFRLRITPQRRGKKYRKMQDIKIGRKTFDKLFIVQGTSRKSVRALLTPRVCNQIRQYRGLAHNRVEINIVGGEITLCGTATRRLEINQIKAIIRNLVSIHQLMLRSVPQMHTVEITYVQRPESTCMVCGDSVKRPQGIQCVACHSRYHEDCWNYMGKCSIYGCRSRRAL